MIDLTQIIIAIIGVLASVAIKFLVPYIKAKTSKENWDLLTHWAGVFVRATEVVVEGSGKGDVKRDKVLSELRDKCEEIGVKFSENDIRSALENAWLDMTSHT